MATLRDKLTSIQRQNNINSTLQSKEKRWYNVLFMYITQTWNFPVHVQFFAHSTNRMTSHAEYMSIWHILLGPLNFTISLSRVCYSEIHIAEIMYEMSFRKLIKCTTYSYTTWLCDNITTYWSDRFHRVR